MTFACFAHFAVLLSGASPVSIDLGKDPSVVIKEAERALKMKPVSVMDKKVTPESGDKHDYMSLGPYWWPDPKKPDGLPYIRKDGKTNPQTRNGDASDSPRFSKLAGAAADLALGYRLGKDERFAKHAALLLRTWFVDPETRMNPNLNFSQAIPGRTGGRGIGIIESRHLIKITDAADLIAASPHWTKSDQIAFKSWCRNFLQWLLTSPHGRDEAATKNNHGSWYDAQVVKLALFTGDRELARKTLASTRKNRFSQIAADGSQPHELKRTKSYDYSIFNLEALCLLAKMGEQVDVDLWNPPVIQKALAFIEKKINHGRKWPYEQIGGIDKRKYLRLLRLLPRSIR